MFPEKKYYTEKTFKRFRSEMEGRGCGNFIQNSFDGIGKCTSQILI